MAQQKENTEFVDNANDLRISVIVPIYNIAPYIKECVASIINQEYWNLEIILIDDGSTDDSPEICDGFAKQDRRIKVIHKSNGGLVSARKAGVKAATGEYVTYVDGDDWIDADLLYNAQILVKKHRPDIITYSGYYKEYEDGRTIGIYYDIEPGYYKKGEMEEKISSHFICTDEFYSTKMALSVWSYMFKRELLLQNQLLVNDSIRIGEDINCVYRCLLEAKTMAISNKIGYHYRQRDGSMLHIFNNQECKNLKIFYQDMKQMFESKAISDALLMKKLNYCVYYTLLMSCYGMLLENKQYLFPYTKVKKGSRLIIYGAGVIGRQLVNVLECGNTGYELVAWTDKGWKDYNKKGLGVISPEKIKSFSYDFIVIAVTGIRMVDQIIGELIQLGVESNKIAKMDINVLTYENLPELMRE